MIGRKKKENKNTGTLKELLPNIKSGVYIVDIEDIEIADYNPIKLKVILSDDIFEC